MTKPIIQFETKLIPPKSINHKYIITYTLTKDYTYYLKPTTHTSGNTKRAAKTT